MGNIDVITKALLLGLSTGVYCLGHCLPVVFPLVFMENQTAAKTRSRIILEFAAGRFLAYLSFGALVGFLGAQFSNLHLRKATAITMIILAVLLLIYALKPGSSSGKKFCQTIHRFIPQRTFPFLLGLVTGFNLCPPFLLAMNYVFQLGEIANGVLFFFSFYLATSVFLLPFIFLGHFSRFEPMRWIAQFSAVLAGGLFLWIGVGQLIRV